MLPRVSTELKMRRWYLAILNDPSMRVFDSAWRWGFSRTYAQVRTLVPRKSSCGQGCGGSRMGGFGRPWQSGLENAMIQVKEQVSELEGPIVLGPESQSVPLVPAKLVASVRATPVPRSRANVTSAGHHE